MSDDGIIIPVCPRCGHTTDLSTCWCGEPMGDTHPDNHRQIPMGCECYRVTSKPAIPVFSEVAPVSKPVYLGDGAYVINHGYELEIFTTDGRQVTNKIHLGYDELRTLISVIREHHPRILK